ncbi:MAG TPA: sulfotransferase [Solirubrobacteraceae bacterium]|nr:sulfotransferase [Solirubrobacteraceae bacterium]
MSSTTQENGIVLIGAGLPRTGTLTQKLALEELGLGPCYHWVNVLADLDEVALWNRALDGDGPWQEVFAGHRSSVDWPGGYFYRELMDFYPQAKVLLSVRDPQTWERSFTDTIVEMCCGESVMPLLARARAQIDPRWQRYMALVDRMFWGPQGTFADGHEPAQLIEQMVRHSEQVKSVVPPERLLVWEVGDGWGPLCEFLGVDVPETPLPHANDRDTFLERVIDGALGALVAWRESESAVPAGG